jgi:hypothetical protein
MSVADTRSSLDIFVSGTSVTDSSFKLGSSSYPALARLCVERTQPLDIQSGLLVGAEIWAGNPKAIGEINSDVFGALFAGDQGR